MADDGLIGYLGLGLNVQFGNPGLFGRWPSESSIIGFNATYCLGEQETHDA